MFNVRQATLDDLPILKDVAIKFLEYHPAMQGGNEEEVFDVVANLITEHTILLAEDDNKFVGALGYVISPTIYRPSVISANEVFLWVEEDYRKTGVADLLVELFEDDAKDNGCSQVTMSSTSKTEFFESWMKSKQYKCVEIAYMKEI